MVDHNEQNINDQVVSRIRIKSKGSNRQSTIDESVKTDDQPTQYDLDHLKSDSLSLLSMLKAIVAQLSESDRRSLKNIIEERDLELPIDRKYEIFFELLAFNFFFHCFFCSC